MVDYTAMARTCMNLQAFECETPLADHIASDGVGPEDRSGRASLGNLDVEILACHGVVEWGKGSRQSWPCPCRNPHGKRLST